MVQPEGTSFTSSPTSSLFPLSSPRMHLRSPMEAKQMNLDTDYKGPVIPPVTKDRRKRRTLVLCFDGTGDQFDSDNSNIVQLFSLPRKGESKQQLVYYQAGIGTYTIPQIATPFASKLRKTWDMMLGSSLHHHIIGGYEFLMENFKHGDRICIFGFSRGAYTARALAGMIEKVGLLPAGNHQQVPFAYKMYMKDDKKGWEQSVLFKRSFSMDVDIEFVGVWDTVDSVGLVPCIVPFAKNNTCVNAFRHAISLDEHRVKFKANLFNKIITQEAQNTDFSYTPFTQRKASWRKWLDRWSKERAKKKVTDSDMTDDGSSILQDKYTDTSKRADIFEVWFSGCHTDVGGGSVANETRDFLTECGIQFEADKLCDVGLDPAALFPVVWPPPPPLQVFSAFLGENVLPASKFKTNILCKDCSVDKTESGHTGSDGTISDQITSTNEEHEELHDALSPILRPARDKLGMVGSRAHPPHTSPRERRRDERKGYIVSLTFLTVNRGRPRIVAEQRENGIYVHRSVQMRMKAEEQILGKKYVPRVKFCCDPKWVD